jgi:hypothetical protein
MTRMTGILVALMIMAGTAAAEVGPGRAMASLNTSFIAAKWAATSETVDGGSLGFALDIFHPTAPVSFWAALSWGQMSAENAENSGPVKRTLYSRPAFFGAKYWLGSERMKGFAGAGLGLWFSRLEATIEGALTESTSREGFGISIPLGASFSLTRGANINAGYTLNILADNSFLDNNLIHSVNLGIGFSWGE